MNEISVVLIDDSHDYRLAMQDFLKKNDIQVTGSFSHQSLLKAASKLEANIAIVGFKTAWSFTWRTIAHIKQYYPDMRIILCFFPNDPFPVGKIQDAGINGLFNKAEDDPKEILGMLKVLKCFILE